MTRGVTPSQPSHASTSGAVTAGTTDPIAAPVMAARSRSPARRSSWSSSPSSSGVRSTAVVRRQCARSTSPSNTPTVVSVLPMSKTRITNPPREQGSHCARRRRRRWYERAALRAPSMPSTMPATGALHRFPRAQSRRSNSWSSGALNAPGSAAAARTAGTSSASTSMRSAPARSARACGDARRYAAVDSDTDRHPVRALVAPTALDQNAAELSVVEHEVVRPLYSHLAIRERLESARGRESGAKRKHFERRIVARARDERHPDSGARPGRPRASTAAPPRRLAFGENQRAFRSPIARERVRDVERRCHLIEELRRAARRSARRSSPRRRPHSCVAMRVSATRAQVEEREHGNSEDDAIGREDRRSCATARSA